ncbi:MmcQ/YjbR family DNA-binding protein [Knoellia koreensis]|uniref:MmcQ/YjbR family DNA-binding protein n=1 Tax=Knoellia koreensis TaxID=2730921 RepID=A0A849HGB5_9MICO|nr:MmcQ/YjbR family DNA-binding protein [Knoellia sp. DB2414S]NNM46219.1 MmcQ/YjbR family DNA-binding protein [Knoellia sp. DB2414S]
MRQREIRPGSPLARVRDLCLAFPQTEQRLSHGEECWFAGGKKLFVMAADHHHDERVAFWAAAPEGVQERLVDDDPDGYFRPPYVGHRGWVGVWLDREVDWDRVDEVVEDAWRLVAPKRLLAAYESSGGVAT